MHIWKTTKDILTTPDNDELFDITKFMDRDSVYFPPTSEWDYSRELTIEDVDIWEVIVDANELSIFAAWTPYAEFYLVVYGYPVKNIETYYGPGSQNKMRRLMKKYGLPWAETKVWVENEKVPFYS